MSKNINKKKESLKPGTSQLNMEKEIKHGIPEEGTFVLAKFMSYIN